MLTKAKKSSKNIKQMDKTRKLHVKVGDTVLVLTGKDKGKTGIVSRVNRKEGKLLVEGINMVKKAVRPNPMIGLQGGLIDMEAEIPASRVMLYSLSAEKPTRIKKQVNDGKKVRVCRHSGNAID